MKKLYTLIAAMIVATTINAQVNVTFNVDITDYIAAGNVLGANGIRIGGNFSTSGGSLSDGTTMVDWTPSDVTGAMTNVAGTNIWTITVQYASFPIPPIEPLVQSYKFVNNDWGTNEGLDPNNTIVSGGCGALDGTDTNRKLTISTLAADTVLNYCWDQCLPCSAAGFQLVNNQSNFSLFPNPANNNVNVSFNSSGNSKIEIFNAIGQNVNTQNLGNLLPGNHKQNISTENLTQGIYFVKLTSGNKTETKTMSIVK